MSSSDWIGIGLAEFWVTGCLIIISAVFWQHRRLEARLDQQLRRIEVAAKDLRELVRMEMDGDFPELN